MVRALFPIGTPDTKTSALVKGAAVFWLRLRRSNKCLVNELSTLILNALKAASVPFYDCVFICRGVVSEPSGDSR